MPNKYRKKPVVIEALQFTGDNIQALFDFMLIEPTEKQKNQDLTKADSVTIHTLEGDMLARPGDWIIKGVKGEYYPCKPDIFHQTYEQVSDVDEEC